MAEDERDPSNGDEGAFKQGFGPYQPMILFQQNKKRRKFQSRWYSSFKWLEYSPKEHRAYCFCCRIFRQTGQYDYALVYTGFQNWKDALQKFRSHKKIKVSHHSC